MKFEDKYHEELACVKPSVALNQKVLNSVSYETKKVKVKTNRSKKMIIAMAACAAMIIMAFNYNNIASFAKSILATWGLSLGNERVDFGEIKPIAFDFETFKSNPATKLVSGSTSMFYNDFYSHDECMEVTGIDMVDSEEIKYSHISVMVGEPGNIIHISSSFDYEGVRFGLNGMATTCDIEADTWGYGTNEEAIEVYEYADGKKAYFVDQGKDVITVYFEFECIMYQLTIDTRDDEWGINMGKEVIDTLLK